MSRVYRRKNAGVSEIIATILTLAITVVLFSTLFIWVDNLQGPLEPSYADFESTYATSGANGYLNITHYGGEVLESWYTEIRILNATTGALVARMSIVDGGIADGAWNIGETWQGVISSFPANSTMILEIMDVSKGVIVWNSRIGEDSDAVKPIVYFVSATPPVVAQGGSLELLARVYDPNGMSDITAVYANMTSVDGAPDIVNLTGNNGSWGLHYNVSITAVEGIHLVRFTAIDSTGNTANLATSVKVLNFSAMEPDLRFLTVNPIPVWEHDYFNVTARAEISSHILDPGNTTLGVSVLSNVQLGLGADRDMGSTSISNVFSTGVNGGVPVAGIQAPGVSGAFQVINLTVRAEDSIGYSMELNTTVTVVNQSVPIIAWGMADPTATILRNDTFRVMAYVIDQQNDVNWVGADLSDLNASWGVIDLNYTGGPYVSGDIDTSTMAFGNYTIWFNATDAQGHQAITYAIQIEIINPEPGEEERPPIITSIRIEYEPVRVGETFNVTATVIDLNGDLNHSDIILNVSELGIGLDEIQLVDTGDHVNFMAENISAPASRGYYNLSVWANDTSPLTNASHSKIILQVFPEVEILDYPDIALQTMLFSTMSPVHAPDTNVTITLYAINLGGMGNRSRVNATIRFMDYGPGTPVEIETVEHEVYMVPTPLIITWHPDSGGEHRIVATVMWSDPVEDDGADPTNNETTSNITVLPSILLVDDDHAPRDGSSWDTVSWMISALESSGFMVSTTLHTVTGLHGPAYDAGNYPLKDYDIVIWMTGYETSNTITSTDMANLDRFLDENRTLWLISEGALNDPGFDLTWAKNRLMVDTANPVDTGPEDPLIGNDNHSITNGMVYNTTVRGPYSRGDYFTVDALGEELFTDATGDVNAATYNQSHWSVFFSFEFSKIRYPADQAALAYNVLRWLGGLQVRSGEDIAIAQIGVTPQSPAYKDDITISAILRNNGANGWDVPAAFYIDGMRLSTNDPRVNASMTVEEVQLNPGEAKEVTITLMADLDPGYHQLRVVADPGNTIAETNELNNEISSDNPIFNLTIYVKYTLLIVDDDESANNGGVLYNTTSNITDSIDTLGYDYTLYTVPLGLRGPEINLVERFKALIWICGEATTNTIMLEDQNVIRNYIENKSGQLWMMGQGILEEISPGDGATSEWFARDILHIAEVYHDVGISDPIQGVLYNEITHGMKYQMDDTDVFADAGDRIVPDSEATGVFWQDESQSHYCTISWESTVTASRIVFMPWEYAFINGLYERPLSFTRAGSRALAWEDDFETGDWSGGPWTENDPGNKLNVNAGGAHTGLFGVEYKGGGGDSQMWTGDIDLSVCTGATLFFNWSCNKMDAGEYVALSLSDDGGGTWNPISSISGGTGVWTPVIQDISAYLVNNMQIMISFSADSAAEAGGVDEFYIDGVGAAGAGPACYDLIVDPDPTNESASVTLYASADAGAGFFVDDIHYWSDVFPAPTSMTPDTPPFGDFQVEDGHVVVDISDWSTWTNGTHTFSVMALDDMGTWGLVSQVNFEITRDSPATSAVSTAPDPTNEALSIDLTATVTDQWSIVQAAEWWWDHVGDAGAGSNHAMAAQDGAFDSLSEVVEATVVSLAPGVYRIFVRGQDANGYWNITGPSAANASTYVDVTVSTSPPITSNVEVSPNPVNSMDSWIHVTANVSDGNSLVIAAEAYIDTDPGEGAATPLTVPAHVLADYPIMVHGDLSISGFSLGNHRVYVRAQQASDGAWGPVSSRLFTITKPDTTGPDVLVATVTPNPTEGALTAVLTAVVRDVQSTVAAAEYFVGTIGSHGSGIALDPTDDLFNSNTEDVNITIDISTWDYGEYQLWILGKDSLNQWSPPISVTLTVSKPPVEEALSARRELAFHVFKFFSHPEERPELRVVSVDLNISGKSPLEAVHPMLDGTYLVSTEVFNNGGVDATATVKLLDGDNLISTQTLVLPAYQKTHVEGIWTPLAVGPREIIVQVTQDSREAFDFNNGAYRSLYTYFFYDDMEEGADKWEHDDTVLLINGEGPLEFLADPMNTTITDSFNDTLGFEWTTDSYHSLPQSIYAEESDRPLPGTGGSVILGLVIDNSVSMTSRLNSTGANWLDVAKEAAINLVDSLAEDSAVCVWAFSGANPLQVQPLTVLSGGGREAVITAIDGMTDGQATQIWDATGFAYTEVNNGLAIYPDLNPAVVVLSDGADYHSNDQSAFGAAQVSKLESASHEWCPWHGMDDGVVIYTEHRGKYPISYLEYGPGGSVSEHGRWWTVPIGNPNRDRFGLLNSTMPIYTIGLALEHYDDPSGASNTTAVWPGEGVFDDLALYTGDLATYPEAGTMEYNLWKIANTSGAEYFYSPTSDMLIEIFQDISEAIGSGVVTRSGEATRAATTECFAETETFSLAGVDDATLSFYHKYDLVMGMNGGVVMVGNSTDGVSFQYRYLIPKESYPGNLNLGDTVYDGQGRVVRWCYNGVSAGGTFGWEHSEVDLSYFAGSEYVRVMFMYYEYGGGGGGGWWLDDIKVAVSRGNSVSVTTDAWDQWELSTSDSVSGQYSWCNNDPRGYFKGGLDNSLYTQPIDLTNALHATMSAYFKFNINATGARPPDTFRVEVSSNNGVTWYPLNLGVRAAKGVSGSGTDMDDGVLDNKTYTGIDPDGDGWIEAGTLTRLNVDLSGWVGKAIIMRFRMVTPSDDNSYFGSAHYEQDPASLGWGGFYMDDVVISGRSITGG